MTKTKDEVLQEIFDNDYMGILDGNFETKEMPYDFWNHGINPILGYRWTQPSMTPQESKRNKFEYPEVDDYNPNTEDFG